MVDDEMTALLGSRICHDLISPLGAIGNGIELMSMSGRPSAPEWALITESVEHANARVKFFRIAFGTAAEKSSISATELGAIVEAYFRGTRLRVRWRVEGEVPRPEAKLALLMLQCLESAMPFGDTIEVGRVRSWKLRGTGARLKIDNALWDLAFSAAPSSPMASSDVHFALVRQAARRIGREVRADMGETGIVLSF